MPLCINHQIRAASLRKSIERLFDLSAHKLLHLQRTWRASHGAPVFTVRGRYTARGWTEWTEGFWYGSSLIQYDVTRDPRFLDIGRRATIERMTPHVTHMGVHDHGFNVVSTYGHLWRLLAEDEDPAEPSPNRAVCELALKASGAVQAARWTPVVEGGGFIHSFNGPHSLFIDTMRSLRSLALAHQLGHVLCGEQDTRISLLHRLIAHGLTSARFAVYYGTGRDAYDLAPGRTAHESLFNVRNGHYRCPSTQQGYSPFTTWTRGLAWALCGFAEQLEFLHRFPPSAFAAWTAAELRPWTTPAPAPNIEWGCTGGKRAVLNTFARAALATAEFYLNQACSDGVPMWDTGAPGLARLGPDYTQRPADPYNPHEPVDTSAAAIAGQGFLRLGNFLAAVRGADRQARRFRQAALTIAHTLLAEPYLATNRKHQGLLLHSVYHRPNGWDYVAPGQSIPNGESSMWGDYHLRELALLIWREAQKQPYTTFFAHALETPRR
jgi:hypothetical protein